MLEQVLKKIVFRRIKIIKRYTSEQVYHLEAVLGQVMAPVQELALRKIFQTAFLLLCAQNKLAGYRLERIFNCWKTMKKRKQALLKKIVNKKNKK